MGIGVGVATGACAGTSTGTGGGVDVGVTVVTGPVVGIEAGVGDGATAAVRATVCVASVTGAGVSARASTGLGDGCRMARAKRLKLSTSVFAVAVWESTTVRRGVYSLPSHLSNSRLPCRW